MANVNIDSKLLEALQQSTCFGIAHDDNVPECKQCDVKAQCKIKTESGANIPTPTVKPSKPKSPKKETSKKDTKKTPAKSTNKSSTKTTSKPKSSKKTSSPTSTSKSSKNMPDFKPMTLDELKQLAEERNVEWRDYNNDNITRMRLVMALKKSYQ